MTTVARMTDQDGEPPGSNYLREIAAESGISFKSMEEVLQKEAESRPPLTRLRELESTLWSHFNETSLNRVQGREGLSVVAAAWLAVVYRQSHSAFVLAEKGLEDAASADVCSALEHGVYLSLLAGLGDAQHVIEST